MITVKMINGHRVHPLKLAQYAANECYSVANPEYGSDFRSKINPEKALWRSGHHTTFEHAAQYFTFQIEGISIADVTFGLHLSAPFYNTSQQSGRFCGEKFKNPDYNAMIEYILTFWPETRDVTESLDGYIRESFSAYQRNFSTVEKLATEAIKMERPRASADYRLKNGYKFAQEQSRIFLPVIFPTGLVYTVNLPTLAALYRVAWLPGMAEAVGQMVKSVTEKFPDLAFMFTRAEDAVAKGREVCSRILSSENWPQKPVLLTKPQVKLSSVSPEALVIPSDEDIHPLNLLPFDPRFMDNNRWQISADIVVSLITLGQDQRHRTIKRTLPRFTGNSYLPPLIKQGNFSQEVADIFNRWRSLSGWIPDDLWLSLAPYGAMVRYDKKADGNAFIHETSKRLCWCAQEEIYQLNRDLREQLLKAAPDSVTEKLLWVFSPGCVKTGRCAEGVKRCCGRDRDRLLQDPFPRRLV